MMTRHIMVGGSAVRVHHLARPPFSVMDFESGSSAVLDANGINWVSLEGIQAGAVLFTRDFARAICGALNVEHMP